MPRCTNCGQEHPSLTRISDEDIICEPCLESDFQFCDSCRQYYDVSFVEFYATLDDRLVCQYCAEDMDPEELQADL